MSDRLRSYGRFEAAGPSAGVPVPPPTLYDQVAASFRHEQDTGPEIQQRRLEQAYLPIIEQLLERGYTREQLYEGGETLVFTGYDTATYADLPNYEVVFAEAQRAGVEGLPGSRDEFELNVLTRDGEREADALILESGGGFAGTIAQFAGGMGGYFSDARNAELEAALLPYGGVGRNLIWRTATSAIAGGMAPAIQVPTRDEAFANLGEEYTLSAAMQEIGFGLVLGAGFQAGGEGAGHVIGRGADAAYRTFTPQDVQAFLAMRRDVAGAQFNPAGATLEALQGFDPEMGMLTPVEHSALTVMEREIAFAEMSPFTPNGGGAELHDALMVEAWGNAMEAFPDPTPRSDVPVRVGADGSQAAVLTDSGAETAFMARVRHRESGGDDGAANSRSSATGRYQFIDSTWLAYYKRRYGTGGLTDAEILARRSDGRIQDRLMRDFTADNAAALRGGGEAVTPGNLYLAHFAGAQGALDILRAAPDARLADVLGSEVINANPFLRGKSADWLVRWASARMDAAPPRRGNSRITFDDAQLEGMAGALSRNADERARAQDALDDAVARADEAAQGSAAPSRAAILDEAAEWEPVLAEFDSRLPELERLPDGPPPEVDWMLPRLQEVVNTAGRSLNDMERIAGELNATVAEVRAAMDHMVDSGAILRRNDGVFYRQPRSRDVSLLEFLAMRGGLADEGSLRGRDGGFAREGDLRSMGAHEWHRGAPGRRKLLHDADAIDAAPDLLDAPGNARARGSHDEAFEAAIEAGYFPEFQGDAIASGGDYSSLPARNAFYAAIRDELHGNPRYTPDARTRTVDGERIGEAAAREDAEDFARQREWFLEDLEAADARLVNDPDIAPLIDEAVLEGLALGIDPVDALRMVAAKRYDDIIARAADELGAPIDETLPGWEPLTDEELLAFLARYETDPELAAGGGGQALEQGAARRSGSDSTGDGEIGGRELARLPEAERTQFLDPDGPAAKAQADSLEHDARADLEAREAAWPSRAAYLTAERENFAQYSKAIDEFMASSDGGGRAELDIELERLRAERDARTEANRALLETETITGRREGDAVEFVGADAVRAAEAFDLALIEKDGQPFARMASYEDAARDMAQSRGFDLVVGERADPSKIDYDEIEARRQNGQRPTDEQILTGLEAARGQEDGPYAIKKPLQDWLKAMVELENRGLRITADNIGPIADDYAAEFFGEIDPRRTGKRSTGMMHAWFENFYAHHTGQPLPFPIEPNGPKSALDARDLGAAADPNVAARQRQEAQLGAEAPMRASEEQDGTMGLPMFDAADAPGFRFDEQGPARSMREVLDDIDAEEADLKNIRDCL